MTIISEKINDKSNNKKEKNNSKLQKVFFFSAIAFVVLLIAFFPIIHTLDADGYFILREGRNIVESGIQYTNTGFIIPGTATVVQQWLWAAGVYMVQSMSGDFGVKTLLLTIYLIDNILFYQIARCKGCNSFYSGIFTIIFSLFMFTFINIRPTLITVMFLMFEIGMLDDFQITKDEFKMWMLPVTMFLISIGLINIHAALWPMVLVFMLPYVVPPMFTKIFPFEKKEKDRFDRKKKLILLVSAIAVIAGGFINPYGIEGMMYLYNSYNPMLNSLGIRELASPSMTGYAGILLTASMLICAYYTFIWKAYHRTVPAYAAYLLAGCLIMTIIHQKNLFLVAFAFPMYMAEIFAGRKDRTIEKLKTNKKAGILAVIIEAVCVLCLIVPGLQTAYPETERDLVPVHAVAWLDDHVNDLYKSTTKIYTDFNTGAYVEYKGYKGFMDARPELYFKSINKKADYIKDYQRFSASKKDYESVMNKYKFDYLIVYPETKLDTYLQNDEKAELVDESSSNKLYKYHWSDSQGSVEHV